MKQTWALNLSKGVRLEWLTCRIWIVQQWLAADWRAKDQITAQSTKLYVSAVPVWSRGPGRFLESRWSLVHVEKPKKLESNASREWQGEWPQL